MDLIFIILSIYIRLFQVAFPLSCSASAAQRGRGSEEWAMWLPVIGWVAILVRFSPTARWLTWRVTGLRRMSRPSWGAAKDLDKHSRSQRLRTPIDDDSLDSDRSKK